MGKKNEEEGAPAYMAQFTALMTLLLAFFICLLTLGQRRTADFRSGVGQIKDAFGVRGGQGVLPFFLPSRRHYPEGGGEISDDAYLQGFKKGSFVDGQFDQSRDVAIVMEGMGDNIVIPTPIRFPAGDAVLVDASRQFLDQIGVVFFGLPEHRIDVVGLDRGEDGSFDLASRRAASVVRYLHEEGGITGSRLRAIGTKSDRFIDLEESDAQDVEIVLMIHRLRRT